MAVFVVFGPLAAMTFIMVVATILSALVYALFHRNHVFDSEAERFVPRQRAKAQ